jgi:glycosyltransferase, group 1 family
MRKIKKIISKYINSKSFLYKFLKKTYHKLSDIKFITLKNIKHLYSKVSIKNFKEINKVIKEFNKLNKSKYVTFYNPTWLGVANSTKGLFKYNVPMEGIYSIYGIKKLAKIIANSDVKILVFSQLCDGWPELIEEIHSKNPNKKIKILWHANNFEVLSTYTWNLNKKIIDLYRKKYVDSFAFVKESMTKFYNESGIKAFKLINNIKSIENIKEEKNKIKRIGVYNSHSRELKNIYTQILSVSLVKGYTVDIVPSIEELSYYCEEMNIKYESINKFIPTEELMERIQYNEINIYPTFTECAPMFPLESFEHGVPCLIGSNNDYFISSPELRKFVTVEREDDPIYIKEKILEVIKNKEKIMKLYKKWKKSFDKEVEILVEEFINN